MLNFQQNYNTQRNRKVWPTHRKKKQLLDTVLKEDQTFDLLNKDFKSAILNIFEEPKETCVDGLITYKDVICMAILDHQGERTELHRSPEHIGWQSQPTLEPDWGPGSLFNHLSCISHLLWGIPWWWRQAQLSLPLQSSQTHQRDEMAWLSICSQVWNLLVSFRILSGFGNRKTVLRCQAFFHHPRCTFPLVSVLPPLPLTFKLFIMQSSFSNLFCQRHGAKGLDRGSRVGKGRTPEWESRVLNIYPKPTLQSAPCSVTHRALPTKIQWYNLFSISLQM